MHHINRLLWQSLARAVVGLGLLAILIFSVTPLDFGTYSGCLAAASTLGAASCWGFDRVILLAHPSELKPLRQICIAIPFALGLAAGAACWLVSVHFTPSALGETSIGCIGLLAIALNGLLQLCGSAAILCTSQFLIRDGRLNTANLFLSFPSIIVLGAQVIAVRLFGSSVSWLATGAIVGWILILIIVLLRRFPRPAEPFQPTKSVLQRWWRPATIRMGTGLCSNARTQLGYLVVFISTPLGAELLAAIRLFDTGGSMISSLIERSWGTSLAFIGCDNETQMRVTKTSNLINSFASWCLKLAVTGLPVLGIIVLLGRYFIPSRWYFVLQIAPPLLIAVTIAAQVAWIERLFEYQRRFKVGLWIEVLIMTSSIALYATLLPMTSGLTSGACVFAVISTSAMLVRGYASMYFGVFRTASRRLLKTVVLVALLAGLVVWVAEMLPK